MVLKIMADQPNCSLQVALSWAVNSKNCLQMVSGYSPYQLVFGRNPRLPNVMDDSLPALEGTTISETLATHLNAMHASRKAFMQTESSGKIRKALRHQVRPVGNKFFKWRISLLQARRQRVEGPWICYRTRWSNSHY